MKRTADFLKMKKENEKIAMITAYDFPSAKQAEAGGTDVILVGDSLGMTVLGLDSTVHVTIDDMIHHTKAVKRGARDTFIITDMPFMTYHGSRLTRVFHSPKHTGIWMSLILKPDLPLYKAPQFTLIAAVAVAEAIRDTAGVTPEIKWPNDLLINGKKITGILTELQADSDRIHSIIIGIGVNVNQQSFPEELSGIATSLAIEKGETVPRAQLVQAILKNLERYYEEYMENGFAAIKVKWESLAVSIGRHITARTANGSIRGKALGITDEGVLKLEDEHGVIHSIYSADIELDQ